MLIGLVGAHRVGKTTLAKKCAEEFGIDYIPASVSATFARLGVSPRYPFTFRERLKVQIEVLKDADAAWSRGNQSIGISDRTPIDMMAYTLAEVGPETLAGDAELEELLHDYIQTCKQVTRRHFKALVVVRPGIPIVDDATKASPCPFYINHLDRMMTGFVMDRDLQCDVSIMRAYQTDLDVRVEIIEHTLRDLMKEHMLKPKGAKVQ